MALIRCRECGKKISEFCGVCPNCGCPVEDRPNEAASDAADQPNAEADRPNAETTSEAKKSELTYIQKRNQRVIRIISAVVLVLAGFCLIYNEFNYRDKREDDVYFEWYTNALENDTFNDTLAEYAEQSDEPSKALLDMAKGDFTGFNEYVKEKLSGKVIQRQLPFYIGGIGCFALAGYLLFSLKKYPLTKHDHA